MCARGREIRRERMRERATEKEREKEVFGGIFLLQRDVYLGILVSTSRSLLLGLIFPEKTYLIFFPVNIKLASGFWNQADRGDWESQCSVYRLMQSLPSPAAVSGVSKPRLPLFYLLIH